MLIVKNIETDAKYNLAHEEYLLKQFQTNEPIVSIWQNKNAVIIGRNQDYHREIFENFVRENEIQVVRRISGGGAVYHDMGNINFSFIVNKSEGTSYKKFLEPIIELLATFGINAIFSGRNDLTIKGKKISGNAQYIYKNRVLHHGTLLFNSDLNKLTLALNPDKTKLESKGIQSIKSRVVNISSELRKKITATEFLTLIEEYFINNYEAKWLNLTKEDKDEIEELKETKYSSESWNIGQSPKWKKFDSKFEVQKRFKNGFISIKAIIRGGKIKKINFSGDFLSSKNTEEIENMFIDSNLDSIKETLEALNIEKYFGLISTEELNDLFRELFSNSTN